VPAFKPAYLIHGDDHGRVAERRARLRAMAEAETGAGGVEVLEGDQCSAEAVAAALSAMTFAIGRRFVIADGVERWKEADAEIVVAAMAGIDPEGLTVAFFAREDGRAKAPAKLLAAVKAAGGAIAAESAVKPWELPRWVAARAAENGLRMDAGAAKALVARVGERQQRLLREVEKLALELGPGATAGVEEVEAAASTSSERKVWALADALVAGDGAAAMLALVELRAQGERIPGLLFRMTGRMREAHEVAVALAAGEAPAQIKGRLRMPPSRADRFIAGVRRHDVEHYARALEILADLELESRGGAGAALGEDTQAVRAVVAIAG